MASDTKTFPPRNQSLILCLSGIDMSLTIPVYVKKMIKEGMPRKKVNEAMSKLERCVDEIFSCIESSVAYRVLYDLSVELVRNKHGERLYASIRRAFQRHAKLILTKVSVVEEGAYLRSLHQFWISYRLNVRKTKDLLLFLDENYVEKKSSHENPILPIYEMGVLIFQNEVIKLVSVRLRFLLLGMIEKERNSEMICDKFLLKNVSKMMVEIDRERVYREEFENHLIRTSERYFRNEATRWFQGSTACEYLRKVLKRLNEEKQRCKRCFHEDTLPRLEKVIQTEMIERYKDLVIKKEGSGLLVMLENHKVDELRLVYEALSLVENALRPTIEMLQDYVTQEGLNIVRMEKSCLQLVTRIIELRVFYEKLLEESFSREIHGVLVKDNEFSKALKNSFSQIVNKNDRFPEYLSLLLDRKMRSGKSSHDDDGTDEFFDDVIMTFQHVREKDVFEKYYKSHLAKRLLSNRSSSDDNEKSFLSKLKTTFGYQFTSKLEGMFKDMKISEELMTEWREFRRSQKDPEPNTQPASSTGSSPLRLPHKRIDLSVQILTSVYWPLGKLHRCYISEPHLNQELERFMKFYDQKHNGRKLTWQFNMGSADLRANGFVRKYEFNVTIYQMVILLLFNDEKELSLEEIHNRTQITIPELKKNLFSLCLPNQKSIPLSRLLLKRSPGSGSSTTPGTPLTPSTPVNLVYGEGLKRQVESRYKERDEENEKLLAGKDNNVASGKKVKKKLELGTKFRPNEKFRSQKMKIKVQPVVKREDSKGRKATREKIDEERRWVIDACIVRIMKMRKTLKHRNLIMEVVQQLQSRFEPRPDSIKKRIESLIDRDYLERDEDDRAIYRYLA